MVSWCVYEMTKNRDSTRRAITKFVCQLGSLHLLLPTKELHGLPISMCEVASVLNKERERERERERQTGSVNANLHPSVCDKNIEYVKERKGNREGERE